MRQDESSEACVGSPEDPGTDPVLAVVLDFAGFDEYSSRLMTLTMQVAVKLRFT